MSHKKNTTKRVLATDSSKWNVDSTNDVIYVWAATMENHNSPSGENLNGDGMGGKDGPTKGIARDNYVGIVSVLPNPESLNDAKLKVNEAFDRISEHLRENPTWRVEFPLKDNLSEPSSNVREMHGIGEAGALREYIDHRIDVLTQGLEAIERVESYTPRKSDTPKSAAEAYDMAIESAASGTKAKLPPSNSQTPSSEEKGASSANTPLWLRSAGKRLAAGGGNIGGSGKESPPSNSRTPSSGKASSENTPLWLRSAEERLAAGTPSGGKAASSANTPLAASPIAEGHSKIASSGVTPVNLSDSFDSVAPRRSTSYYEQFENGVDFAEKCMSRSKRPRHAKLRYSMCQWCTLEHRQCRNRAWNGTQYCRIHYEAATAAKTERKK